MILEKIDYADFVNEIKKAAKGQKTKIDPALLLALIADDYLDSRESIGAAVPNPSGLFLVPKAPRSQQGARDSTVEHHIETGQLARDSSI
jgi:hypothetical protein